MSTLISPRTFPLSPSALLPTPLLVPLSPSSQPSLRLLPHARGPMEVNYLSVNRLVMTPRQGASGPLALNASMAFAWSSRPPGATINVKCNKRPVNKTEHCQTWSLLIDCWSKMVPSLCAAEQKATNRVLGRPGLHSQTCTCALLQGIYSKGEQQYKCIFCSLPIWVRGRQIYHSMS